MLLGAGCELLAESQLDDGLLAARPEQGRQSREKNRCVSEESPNHGTILKDFAGEIESDSRDRLRVGCSIRPGWRQQSYATNIENTQPSFLFSAA